MRNVFVKQTKHYCIIVIHKKETAFRLSLFIYYLTFSKLIGTSIDV